MVIILFCTCTVVMTDKLLKIQNVFSVAYNSTVMLLA